MIVQTYGFKLNTFKQNTKYQQNPTCSNDNEMSVRKSDKEEVTVCRYHGMKTEQAHYMFLDRIIIWAQQSYDSRMLNKNVLQDILKCSYCFLDDVCTTNKPLRHYFLKRISAWVCWSAFKCVHCVQTCQRMISKQIWLKARHLYIDLWEQ